MAPSLSNLMARFRQAADPAQAVKMAAYMKNRFPFFGIPQPQRKALTREFLKESKRVDLADVLAWVRELYEQPERECHYLALDLLERNYQRLMYEDFQCTFGLIDQNAWWDSVDALRKSMSLWVKANRQHLDEVMHKLLAADSIWWRRVALTFQLSWKEQTDTAWLERLFCKTWTMASSSFRRQLAGLCVSIARPIQSGCDVSS